MRTPIANDSEETYMPKPQSPQEEVIQAYCQLLEERNKSLTRGLLRAQVECWQGNPTAASAVISQVLSSM